MVEKVVDKIDILKPGSVHIIGIGGSGTFYLARFLHLLGWRVTGSDISETENVSALKKDGIKVFKGNAAKNLDLLEKEPEIVIYSPAVPCDVPELRNAIRKNLRVMEYGSFLDLIFSQLTSEVGKNRRIQSALERSNFDPLYNLDFSKVKVIGVTGTKGKTTVAMMIYHILTSLGINTGVVTTVMAKIGDKEVDTGLHTTSPPAQELAPIIKEMIDKKAEVIVLEITSHGLSMHRVEGVPIDTAVYTNISREHLDYHKTWKEYASAKARMIDMIRNKGKVVLNMDDKSFGFLNERATAKNVSVVSYGLVYGTLVASKVWSDKEWVYAEVTDNDSHLKHRLKMKIIGEYNVFNALAAVLACREIGVTVPASISALSSFKGVPGRMEVIQYKPFYVIVDFAHTPDSLEFALKSVGKLRGKNGRLFAIFGCAGLRDTSKRPKMGSIAAEFADVIVLTAEDPRTETVSEINNQIVKGIKRRIVVYNEGRVSRSTLDKDLSDGKKVVVRFDEDLPSNRRGAIRWAIKNANEGDVVIVLGKGHEKSLCFGKTEYPWSDKKELLTALSLLKSEA